MIDTPVVVVVGRQGAGKGVQCARLARSLGANHLSTGDVLRMAIRAGDRLGRQVAPFVEAGDLVPDELITGVVAHRLTQARTAGWGVILDGFPRTVRQGELLLAAAGARFDVAVHLEVPRELALDRLARRVVCMECGATGTGLRCATCGGPTERRQDDNPAAIARRLDAFEAETSPLIAWLDGAGLLVTVDGVGSTTDVARRVEAAVLDMLGSGDHEGAGLPA